MSSDPSSGAPSPGDSAAAAGAAEEPASATLVATRGEPLLEALERHLPGSLLHADGTASHALATAAALGLSPDGAELVREVARLHDVGKVYVPAALLQRPVHELRGAEAKLVESQFRIAARLLRGAGMPAEVCDWTGAVGKRFDAIGPDHPPRAAQIIRAACAWDAMVTSPAFGGETSDRLAPASAALRGAAGAELDPAVVDALLRAVRGLPREP